MDNKIKKGTFIDYIIYFFGVILAVILYTFASFYSTTDDTPTTVKQWIYAIGVGVFFAAVEYMVKVPVYIVANKFLEPVHIHLVWIVMAFFGTNLFQLYYMKKDISIYVWLVGALIVLELAFLLYLVKHHD